MRSQVAKWGNSLAVRIPSALAREVSLQEGRQVNLRVEAGNVVIVPVEDPSYDLAELLAAITDENRPEEISTGKAVGNEFA